MKKLLQDKRVVGALVIGSVLVAGWPVIRAQMTARARSAAAPAPEVQTAESPAPAVVPASVTPAGSPSLELRDWINLRTTMAFVRDPFRRVRLEVEVADIPRVVPGLPTLQATSMQGGKSLAVIDRRIVSQGARIGEFVVEAILAGEVLLRRDGSTAVHRLDLHATARKLTVTPRTNGVVAAQEPTNKPGRLELFSGTP